MDPPQACFKNTDVASYQAILDLFDFFIKKYGRVDTAVSCAGIIEIGNWFDPSLDLKQFVKCVSFSFQALENGEMSYCHDKSRTKKCWMSTCLDHCILLE